MTLNKTAFEEAFNRSQKDAPTESGVEKDPAVQKLWGLLEPELEDKGLFEHEHRENLREKNEDIRSWRKSRGCAMAFAVMIVLIMLLMIVLVTLTLIPTFPWHLNVVTSDGVKIAFISATFGIIFGLTALLLKGAFTPSAKDDGAMMPEGLKTLVEAAKSLIGRG